LLDLSACHQIVRYTLNEPLTWRTSRFNAKNIRHVHCAPITNGVEKLQQQCFTTAFIAALFVLAELAPANAVSPWVPLPVPKSIAIDDALYTGDADAGRQLYGRKCGACHHIDTPPGHRVGPDLAGIVSRPAAAHKDFIYSSALRQAAGEGLVWTRDFLNDYLRAPNKFLPEGSMAFVGIASQQERDDLIAYLASQLTPSNAPWLLSRKIVRAAVPLPEQNPIER
jgi:cytochrome c